jgi:hypothetical protein
MSLNQFLFLILVNLLVGLILSNLIFSVSVSLSINDSNIYTIFEARKQYLKFKLISLIFS